MPYSKLNAGQLAAYQRDGYLIVKSFCSKAETDKLYHTALEDQAMANHAVDLNDQSGKKTKLSLWFTPGNDVFGYLTRSEKMLGAVKQLLDGETAGLPFSFQADAKATQSGRRLGMAPGLWLLV